MLKSEKKALARFLLLYTASIFLFISVLAYGFYNYEKEMLAKNSLQILQQQKQVIIKEIKQKDSFHSLEAPPKLLAIYDRQHHLVFGELDVTLPLEEFGWHEIDGTGYFISRFPERFLEKGIIALGDATLSQKINATLRQILWFTLFALVFFLTVGYFLAKLFLQPMRQNIQRLDHFIQDATHEMNTPISSILMSIETCDAHSLEPALAKKLSRISNAAKTLSHIYEDLVFLNFSDRFTPKNETCDLHSILQERIDYFHPIADAKQIEWHIHLSPISFESDPHRIRRIIDNLISNAIKYNHPKGKIYINLSTDHLHIENEGPVIPPSQMEQAFERYQRLNSDQGGFGIGLSTIKALCQELNVRFTLETTPSQTTRATLSWS